MTEHGDTMSRTDLRDRYLALLIDRIEDARYPSAAQLDRVERAVRTRSEAEAYLEALIDTVEQDRYPSPTMLERITRIFDGLSI